ncbi:MAG: ABC transporter ATP-binding protein [Gemmataceae bacterium]
MLQVRQVSKIYQQRRRQRVVALDQVSLTIPAGDFVALVGPSGSGKSTLLLMLGGMLTPTFGTVFLQEQSLYDLSVPARTTLRREQIGFVFQNFNLVPYLTALENVQVPLFLAGWKPADQRRQAAAMLERVGLADRLDHKPSELSAGQQQRVALARTLANDPAVILADEPTGNLDPATRQQVMSFLQEFNTEGRTIVMVTHDPQCARLAKRIVQLAAGVIQSDDLPPRPIHAA